MDKQEVRDKIIARVMERTSVGEFITPEDNLRSTLGLDSIDMFDLLLDCEVLFGIDLGKEAEEVQTVQDLIDLVYRKLS